MAILPKGMNYSAKDSTITVRIKCIISPLFYLTLWYHKAKARLFNHTAIDIHKVNMKRFTAFGRMWFIVTSVKATRTK